MIHMKYTLNTSDCNGCTAGTLVRTAIRHAKPQGRYHCGIAQRPGQSEVGVSFVGYTSIPFSSGVFS